MWEKRVEETRQRECPWDRRDSITLTVEGDTTT
jgi:hypothetical protein